VRLLEHRHTAQAIFSHLMGGYGFILLLLDVAFCPAICSCADWV
jgi:hypothetical protein